MTKFLEENDIDVRYFVRKEEGKLSLEQENGKHLYVGARVKHIYHVYVSDVSISDSHSYISYSETSIPSLEESPNSSPKFPPNTSHFSLVSDLSSERSFPHHSYPSYSDFECNIQADM